MQEDSANFWQPINHLSHFSTPKNYKHIPAFPPVTWSCTKYLNIWPGFGENTEFVYQLLTCCQKKMYRRQLTTYDHHYALVHWVLFIIWESWIILCILGNRGIDLRWFTGAWCVLSNMTKWCTLIIKIQQKISFIL